MERAGQAPAAGPGDRGAGRAAAPGAVGIDETLTLYDEPSGTWRTYRRLPPREQCDDPLCEHPGCAVPTCADCEEPTWSGWVEVETPLVICAACAEAMDMA